MVISADPAEERAGRDIIMLLCRVGMESGGKGTAKLEMEEI